MLKPILTALLFFVMNTNLLAQIAGSFTVPGSFPTLAAAINTLNLTGVAGPVTINIAAGYTETVPTGGLKLINPPGNATTTILFQKQGSGSNPLLRAYSGGTATSSSNIRDGIWMLAQCKNVTIDGIDLIDLNTSAPATMEYGYGFYKVGSSGNRYNTIKNCVITLGTPATSNAHGIDLTCYDYLYNTSAISPSSTLQTNSFNVFQKNLIQKCDVGIWIYGDLSANLIDESNIVGGTSAVSGNTIVNFGGSSAFAQAVHVENQVQFNASFNTINSNNGLGTTAYTGIEGIYANYCPDASLNSNTITLSASGSYFNPLIGIRQIGFGGITGTVNINNNVFPSLSYTSTSISLSTHSIILTASSNVVYINNNQIGNFTLNSGTVNIIAAISGYTSFINNNSISGVTVSTNNGIIQGISASTYQQEITNNSIGNLFAPVTSTSAYSSITGINVPNGTSVTVSNNTVTNIYGGNLMGINMNGTVSVCNFSVANNRIMNLGSVPTQTFGSTSIGILINLPLTSGTMTIKSNTVANIAGMGFGSSMQGGSVEGILGGSGANAYVSQNKVYDLVTSGTYGIHGIRMTSANSQIFNNVVGNLQATTTNVDVLSLNVGNHKVYYNSLYLNNTASPPGDNGTNLISCTNNASLELRNNVLVNTSVATGTGITAIIIVNNLAASSNRNAFYFGTPGPSRRISWGVPSSSVMSAFQNSYSSDAQSFIENVPFASTTGSATNFLNINPTVATQIEGGASTISTITTDFINATRSSTPDIGAWEGNYTAADATPPVIISSGFAGPPCNASTRTFTANLSDVSGIANGTLAPILYYRVNFGLYTSAQGTLTSGTFTNGNWSFGLNYTANTGDIIWYFLVLQDLSYLNNLLIVPASGATVSSVNNVLVPPNPASNYTIQTFPTISVAITSATVCANQSFVIQASGANSFSYLPGNSATVFPVSNATYYVSGESSQGCASTNTISVYITALPIPTITVNSGNICLGQSFTLNANGASSYTYEGGSAIVSPLSTSVYTVIGSITPQGCSSLPVTATVNVLLANIGALSNTTQICRGDYITLNGTGGVSYNWSGSVINNIPFSPSTTAVYTVTGNAANGCVGSKTIQVIVYPAPNLSLSATSNTVCEGEEVTVTASGAINYTWQPNAQFGSVYTTTLFNSVNVNVIGSDVHGCKSIANIILVADPCVGIKELIKENVKITPNPTNGNCLLSYEGSAENISVRVIDLNGCLVFESPLFYKQSNIHLSNYKAGIYVVEVFANGSVVTRLKLVLTNQ